VSGPTDAVLPDGRTVRLARSAGGWRFLGVASWITDDLGQAPLFPTVEAAVAWLIDAVHLEDS